MKYVDLHAHTVYSDGLDTPGQVVRSAKLRGLDMISIADHDSIKGYYDGLSEAKVWGIDLIPGVEITTIEHHLLGLNFDPENVRFSKFVKYSQEIQAEVCRQRVELLTAHGVPITLEKIENAFPFSTHTKYVILMAMLSDAACRDYLEKNHGRKSIKDLFNFYLGRHGIASHVEKRRVITWEEGIDEIHRARGMAVLPHPGLNAESPSDIENLLKQVDGLEYQPRFGDKNAPFIDYARERELIITFGSDYHGSASDSPLLLGLGDNFFEDDDRRLFRMN